MNLNGSQELNFYPLGKKTEIMLSSDWKDPSFQGKFLPAARQINEQGFEASWKVFNLNRNYPQQWLGTESNVISSYIKKSAFGVDLMLPVDLYQKTTRSVKYAVMFILMTFLVYFFAEILNSYNIHPIQYLLVGFALIIFYWKFRTMPFYWEA
ncbi:MAG: inner membrane CreD family protein [Halanaerobiales bacterium]